jgi:hypothetical protein
MHARVRLMLVNCNGNGIYGIATGYKLWYGYDYGNGNGNDIAGTLHSGGYGGSDSPLG